ncbi:MAG: hypothetical protein HC780_12185 [Leptolyngbyaceae cyanobacterium CSU_1_3]|nr:hypothetical protein [Leptolyngbyaceae cyanobacterium CSU_1_3]
MTFSYLRLCQLASVWLIATSTACVQVRSPQTEFTVQVEPAQQQGSYTVTGRTNLPDFTWVTVQAVRNLNAVQGNQKPTYSILARSQVEVREGKWETTLNLLQPSDGGAPLEVWQGNRSLNLKPETNVTFLAVTDPASRSLNISEQQAGKNLVARFTADGKSYLQAEQTLAVSPPTRSAERAAPPQSTRVKVASKRLQGAPDAKSQNDAPLSPKEFLR